VAAAVAAQQAVTATAPANLFALWERNNNQTGEAVMVVWQQLSHHNKQRQRLSSKPVGFFGRETAINCGRTWGVMAMA